MPLTLSARNSRRSRRSCSAVVSASGDRPVAAATTSDADILIMDEWLAVGDADFQAKARERLLGLVNKASIYVLASHSTHMIRNLCNKFIEVNHGRVGPIRPISEIDMTSAVI